MAEGSSEDTLARLLEAVAAKGLVLYPAQEEAILELLDLKNVILNTPTGSGKSLVAWALLVHVLERRERAFYTCPIKALVSEKFFSLCEDLGAENVGMMTGDATVNRDAPIICCTAEVLANLALREGAPADVDVVVMDEFHYYADRDRGVAWQIPLLTLPHARFLLMSATLGDTKFFEERLTDLNGQPSVTVRSMERPVPLHFEYRETPLHETLQDLVRLGKAPVYVVSFTQRGAAEEAQNLMSVDFSSKEEKKRIYAALEGVQFSSPYGKEVQKFLRHGIGLHHAGLLPKYRLLVEKLAQKGLLKIICGTDTLGVGVNVPIRTVLFTRLCKFDGEKTALLSVRDFRQISGRAGRKGFDVEGFVVAQAPEHVIENLRLESKAGNDKAKQRKIVKKRPPDKGYVHWDRATFDRILASEPEPLQSRFVVTHAMLLNVLQRTGGGCRSMARLIKSSHESHRQKRQHSKVALQMFKSLLEGEVITIEGGRPRVNADLQDDFSLNHALSLWVLDALDELDPESETYALDLLTLVESTLENPDIVLMKQLDALKTAKMAEMKAAGVEYDDRIAELEKMEYPKPLRDFVYDTFNRFASRHPWVGAENVRPKSVARNMVEMFASFAEYVREYDLQRAEGTLLRYLSDAYKALDQNIPAAAKNEAVEEIVTYLRELVRGVDSSLIDEWERMRSGAAPPQAAREVAPDTRAEDERALTVLVRNAVFSLVRALATRDYEAAAQMVMDEEGYWTADRFASAMAAYYDDHQRILTDPAARAPGRTRIERKPQAWRVEQTLVDPDGHDDWVLALSVDLARTTETGRPALSVRQIGP